MRYRLQRHDGTDCSATMVPITVLRMVPIQRYRQSETGWQEGRVDVQYGEYPKFATSICVQFLSTDKTSFSNSDFDKNKSITFPVMGDWNAHVGSMLYIDDISLIFDK